MKKKILLVLAVLICTPVLLAGILYISLSVYYSGSFASGIFINGVYATGLTAEQMNERLMQKKQLDTLYITDRNGVTVQISLGDIGYTYSYEEPLRNIQKQMNPFLWFSHMNRIQDYTIEPKGTYDEARLAEKFGQLAFVQNAVDEKGLKVEIVKEKDGYELIDTTDAFLNKEKSLAVIGEAVVGGICNVDLAEKGCYEKIDYTSQMKETLELYDRLDHILRTEITYKFDNRDVVLARKQISDLILVDENGDFVLDEQENPCLDEEKLEKYIEQLADQFDTVKQERRFKTTRGDTVVIKAGTYGNKLDQKQEKEYLLAALNDGRTEQHEPIYSQRAWGTGSDDIGTTYIEVDLTNQMLYYYKNGRQILNANVVTGNVSRGNGTPAKACYVYYMQRNRVLRGADYATPVDYWMAVYGNIGIHDAKWRGRFGGSIYKTNGSHGCINTPYKEVSQLYGEVEVGTPVMIYY